MRRHLGMWAAAAVLSCASAALAGDASKPRKPQLDLRATPRVSIKPTSVLVTGQLKGGADLEEFYCPGLEWDWGDGTRSEHEADCEPFGPGATLERVFMARHAFRSPGSYNVRLTLRRADRTVAVATVAVTVYGMAADASDF